MRRLKFVGPVLLVAALVCAAAAISAGGSQKDQPAQMAQQPGVQSCGIGYIAKLETKTSSCVPALFKVQARDTLSEIAEWMGRASSWRTLCRYHIEGDVFVISFPGFDPRDLRQGDYVGGCPRNHHELASVGPRINRPIQRLPDTLSGGRSSI